MRRRNRELLFNRYRVPVEDDEGFCSLGSGDGCLAGG